jgi:hypothetical protein
MCCQKCSTRFITYVFFALSLLLFAFCFSEFDILQGIKESKLEIDENIQDQQNLFTGHLDRKHCPYC